MIGKIINPNKILDLRIFRTETDGVVMVLSHLKNLRSLTMWGINVFLDYKLLLTQMRALTSLFLYFEDGQATEETLN